MQDSPAPPGGHADQLGFDRLVFFSDAVMAIAITLLAIEIRLPEIGHGGPATVWEAIGSLGFQILGFVISFLVIGSYWIAHHRLFRIIQRYDNRLLWLNFLFLFCIVLQPFASDVIGEYGNTTDAAVLYAILVTFTGIAETVLWLYASSGHRLIDPALPASALRGTTIRALLPPLVFLISIPIAFISPYLANMFWIALLTLSMLAGRITRSATQA